MSMLDLLGLERWWVGAWGGAEGLRGGREDGGGGWMVEGGFGV